jgi:hypothetical protein
VDVEPTLGRDWIAAAAGSDAIMHLTADELAELRSNSTVSRPAGRRAATRTGQARPK